MKQHYPKLTTCFRSASRYARVALFLLGIAVFSAHSGKAALSGTYTINSGAAASASNYVSFEAAVSDLLNGTRPDGGPVNGPGITATTIFNVANGTYTLSATLNIRAISGASAANRVIFRSASGLATGVTVQYTSLSTAQDAVFRLKGADYVMFERMTILNNTTNSSFGKGIYLDTAGTLSNTSDSIIIRGCIIRTRWWVSQTNAAIFSVVNCKNLRIIGNTIQNTFGIWFNGLTTTPYPTGLQIDSNTFSISGSDAFKPINVRYASGVKIRYNLITKSGCCADAHMEIGFINGASEISYNRVNSSSGSNGILLDNINPNIADVTKVKVYNNMLAFPTSNIYGIRINNCRYLDVFHNNIYLTSGGSTTSKAIECYNSSANATKVSISNNILFSNGNHAIHITGSSAALARQMLDTLDYNVYFNNATTSIAHFQGTDYTTITAFKGAVYTTGSGNDANSYQRNPQFTSTTDLHVAGNNCFLGRPGLVSNDWDGNTRPTKCMIGADEPSRINNNIGAERILNPTPPFSTGLQDIKFAVMNFGSNTVSSFNAGYHVNYAGLQTNAYTVSLNTCDSVHVTFTGAQQYNFGGGFQTLRTFTNLPNGVADANTTNDSSVLAVCQPLNGTYTIGGVGANYANISTAFAAASGCGISGPVRFRVNTGTYNEQLTIGLISGVSATNTITLESATGNPSDVTISFAGTSTRNYVIGLTGARRLIFRRITVNPTSTSFGRGVDFQSNNSFITFNNVIFNAPSVTTNSLNQAIIHANGGINNDITVDSCQLNNGSYGIYSNSTGSNGLNGASYNWVVRNNVIMNQYFSGAYFSNMHWFNFHNNIVNSNSAFGSNTYGVYAYWICHPSSSSANWTRITNNRISYPTSNPIGIYMSWVNVNSGSTNRTTVANNFVSVGRSGGTGAVALWDGSFAVDYVYNSFNNLYNAANVNYPCVYLTQTSTGNGTNNLYNNIMASTAGAYAIRMPSSAVAYPNCNYNDIYSTSTTNLGYFNVTICADLAAWRTNSGRDANSISADPLFATSSDLHASQALLNSAGNSFAGISTDIDGQTRCPAVGCLGGSLRPDIGADEFTLGLDAATTIKSPLFYCGSGGTMNVNVRLENRGAVTLTSATINWYINGTAQTPYSWTGSLASGAVDSSIILGSYAFTTGTYVLKVESVSPNGSTDANPANDSTRITVGSRMSGVYTIGGTTPNYATFAAALSDLHRFGVCGPVVFQVRSGTYTEQIQIRSIAGVSATNTITFVGAGRTSTILTFAATLSNRKYTLLLNNAARITFRDMSINGTGASFQTPVHIMGTTTNNIRFARCNMNAILSTSSTNYYPVIINNDTNTLSTNGGASFITFDSCNIMGGYASVYMYGSSANTPRPTNITFSRCYFGEFSYYGFQTTYTNNLAILNNIFKSNSLTTSTYGLFIWYTQAFFTGDSATSVNRINGNVFKNNGQYGVYIYNVGTGRGDLSVYRRSQFFNNVINGNFRSTGHYCAYFNVTNGGWDIYHNSMWWRPVSGSGGGFATIQVFGNNYKIRNNVFAQATGGSNQTLMFSNTLSSLDSINNNNYWSADLNTSQLVRIGGVTYTGANYKTMAGANSINQNLGWFAPDSMTITEPCFHGMNLGITNDVRGFTRGTPPDIGAYEAALPATDLAAEVLYSPPASGTGGTMQVRMRVRNLGASAVTTVTGRYRAGTAPVVTETFTLGSPLNSCDTALLTFSTNYTQTSGCVSFYAQVDNAGDSKRSNDTLKRVVGVGIVPGTYTIGGTSPNFATIGDALNAICCGGIVGTGNVIFSIRPGVYNEQVNVCNIPNTSSTNQVIFQSSTGIQSDVNITFNSTLSTANYTVQMNSANFIQFRDLTITATNASFGRVLVVNGGGNCTFSNVKFQGFNTTSTSSNYYTIFFSTGTAINYSFNGCSILEGSYAVYYNTSGNSNHTFSKCTWRDFYYNGLYSANSIPGLQIDSCTFDYSGTTQSPYTGILIFNTSAGTRSLRITRNRFININGGSGIYTSSVSGSSTFPIIIANNFFHSASPNAVTALNIQYTNSFVEIAHNTVSFTANTNASSQALTYTYPISSFQNVWIRNNHLLSGPGLALSIPSGSTIPVSLSSNNYFGTGSNLLNWGGTNYANSAAGFTAYRAASGESTAQNDPMALVAANDPHIANLCSRKTGVPITAVGIDIDGETRSTTNPTIGCDEPKSAGYDIGITRIIDPAVQTAGGTIYPKVVIRNFSSNAVDSARISYRLGSGTPVTEYVVFGSPLNQCDSAVYTFTTGFSLTSGCSTIRLWTAKPNGFNDNQPVNDSTATRGFGIPMSGTYTIGGSSPDFTTITSALSALCCSGGVNGPVTFNIRPGTYNEQLTVCNVFGASSTNTITFQSSTGIQSDVAITFGSTVSTANWTVNIANSRFIRFRDLTIAATGTSFGNAVAFTGSPDNITFTNVRLTAPVVSSTSSNMAVVFANNAYNSNILFDRCTFRGGSSAAYLFGTSGVYSLNNKFRKCDIKDFYYYGIYLYYQNAPEIDSCIIDATGASPTNVQGLIYTYFNTNATRFTRNRLYLGTNAGYGINAYQITGTAGTRALIANNYVYAITGSGTPFGIYTQYSTFLDVAFNTIDLRNNTSSGQYGFYSYHCCTNAYQNLDVRNNIIHLNAGYLISSNYPLTVNYSYNDYFTRTTPAYWTRSTNYTGYSAYMAALAETGAQNKLINFVAPGDPHLKAPCDGLTGITISGITTDIDGQTRTVPHIGADEAVKKANDAQLARITRPTGVISPGSDSIMFVVRNVGSNAISSIKIGYRFTGGTNSVDSATFTLSPSLASCDSVTLKFVPVTISGGYSILKVFVQSMNSGTPDDDRSNDTATSSFCTQLNGTYTVGGVGANFASPAEAVSALYTCGITGPVVFKINAGTYNQQLNFNGPISGASAVNTVTIDGVDSATRKLAFTPTSTTARYVLRFSNVKHVTVKNLAIYNNGTSYGWGVLFRNTTDSVTLRKLNVRVNGSSTSAEFIPVVFSGSESGYSTTGLNARNVLIDSSAFRGGYFGATLYSGTTPTTRMSNIRILTSRFDNQYYYGIYSYYARNLNFSGNSIGNMRLTTPYGIYMQNNDTSVVIDANEILGLQGGYGIYLNSCMPNSADPGVVSNNMIQLGSGSNTAMGIFANSSAYTDFINNSILVTGSNTGLSSVCMQISSNTAADYGNRVLNNVMVNNAGGFCLYFSGTLGYVTSGITECDNNNFFGINTNPNAIYTSLGIATTYTFANWPGALYTFPVNNDLQSKNINPSFYGPSNLHAYAFGLDSAAKASANVTKDFDRQTRDLNYPDMGADEFERPDDDAGVTDISRPVNPLALGSIQPVLKFKNFGKKVLDSVKLTIKIDATTITKWWYGALMPNQETTDTLTAYNFTSGASMTAWTSLPNGAADGLLLNDTFRRDVCPGLSGVYTINPGQPASSTNYTSVGAAISALNCGILSNVTFNIKNGTYTGQHVINEFPNPGKFRVTFQADTGLAAFVTIDATSTTSAANYTIQLNQADRVTFRNLTLKSSGTTLTRIIHLKAVGANSADSNYFENVIFQNGLAGTSTSTNYASIYADGGANQALRVTRSVFNSGSMAVYTTGVFINVTANGFLLDSNTLNTRYYGYFLNYVRDYTVTRNIIAPTTGTFHYGIYTNYAQWGLIEGNRILIPLNGHGIYNVNTNLYGGALSTMKIQNNFIRVSGTSTNYGVYLNSTRAVRIAFNSISTNGTGNPIYASLTDSAFYKDNSIYNNSLQSSTGYAIYLTGSSAMTPWCFSGINNNNLFTGGSNLAYLIPSNYTTLAGWQGTGFDANGVSGDPAYFNVATNDLHSIACVLNGNASVISDISNDIDGQPRNGATPDIGADEFTNDVSITAITNPTAKCWYTSSEPLSIRIKNTGNVNLNAGSSFTGYFSNNGSSATANAGSLSALLAPDSGVTFNFSSTADLASANYNRLRVWISGIGCNASNDTMTFTASNKDITVSRILTPLITRCALSATETVSLRLKNLADTLPAGTVINLGKVLNGGTPATQNHTLTSALLPGDSVTVTFSGTTNMSVADTNRMALTASLACGGNRANDTLRHTYVRCDIHPFASDYEVKTNCPVVPASANDWVEFYDGSGKIVFALKANGNNLDTVCWGVRTLSGSSAVRKTNLVYWGLDSGYWMNRNLWIETRNKPTSKVDFRFYFLKSERDDMRSKIIADGFSAGTSAANFTADSLIITKYDGPKVDIDPTNNGPAKPTMYEAIDPTPYDYNTNGEYFQYQVDSFSEMTPTFIPGHPMMPLPVQLLDFTARRLQDRQVLVNWVTADEESMQRYELERSFDGVNFFQICSKDAMNGNSGRNNYSWIDNDPKHGEVVYYRIRLVEMNGIERLSPIRAVMFSDPKEGNIAVFPNPFNTGVQAVVTMAEAETVTLKIFDVTGRLMASRQLELNEGRNDISIRDLQGEADGVYLIEITTGLGNRMITRVVKSEK